MKATSGVVNGERRDIFMRNSRVSIMKKILYIDMDDVLCDFTSAHSTRLLESPEQPYPQSQKGFYENLIPIDGGIRAVTTLRNHFDVYLLTAPSTMNPLSYTEKRLWVEAHLGYEMVLRLIISPNKGLLMGDFLIDDHAEGRGQEHFQGELIQFTSALYPDWKSVINYLLPSV